MTTRAVSVSVTADLVGIDIGGSKTHGIRTTAAGDVVAEAIVGSANIESVSEATARTELDRLFGEIGGSGLDVVAVGSAGINTPAQERWLADLVSERAPQASVLVVHDTRLVLATGEVDAGIAVICGTGSVAWGRSADGRTARSGGWGYLLGDEGSGWWVTREAVRAILAAADRGRPADPLADALTVSCGVQTPYDLLGMFYARADRRYWADQARVVFELAAEGSPLCRGIVEAGAAALVEMIGTVGEHLGLAGPVVLGGGLMTHQPMLQDQVRRLLTARGMTQIEVLSRDPVFGALYLARRTQATSAGSSQTH